jgi:hypothetical protein
MTTITINLDTACSNQIQDIERLQMSADHLAESAICFSQGSQGYQQFIQARKDFDLLLEEIKTNYKYVVIK